MWAVIFEMRVIDCALEVIQAGALVWVIRELRRTRHVEANQQAVLRRLLGRQGPGQSPSLGHG